MLLPLWACMGDVGGEGLCLPAPLSSLRRDSKWGRIMKILGSQENSPPGLETDSRVLFQAIHPGGLELPQLSFTLAGLALALPTLIPVTPAPGFPDPSASCQLLHSGDTAQSHSPSSTEARLTPGGHSWGVPRPGPEVRSA